jgi:predicted Zn-dependent protease with MMP-like domain
VFDSLVLAAVARLEERWREQLRHVEFAVEEVPLVPDDWAPDAVPLATLVRGGTGASTRLVVFRRPVEQRCEGRDELAALVTAVLVEQVAELLGLAPHEIDPDYEAD